MTTKLQSLATNFLAAREGWKAARAAETRAKAMMNDAELELADGLTNCEDEGAALVAAGYVFTLSGSSTPGGRVDLFAVIGGGQ